MIGDGQIRSRLRKVQKQAIKFFRSFDPKPNPEDIQKAHFKRKPIHIDLWTNIFKIPTTEENRWIVMNNLLVKVIFPFP